MSVKDLFDAVYADAPQTVARCLRENPALATARVEKPKLFEGKILHWLYVGDTALHLAAAGHRPEITQLLLAAGADPNASDNHRESAPLHYAADSNPQGGAAHAKSQRQVLKLLLDAGAEIDVQDKNGATPLHRAVRSRGGDAVAFLLKAGADASIKNNSGSTAFHLAVQNTGKSGSGSEEAITAQRNIIETFLLLGANIKQRDGQGKSVCDCAKSTWIKEMLRCP